MTDWSACPDSIGTSWSGCNACCLDDSFTDSDGTFLQDHTPETGSWTKVGAADVQITGGQAVLDKDDQFYIADSCADFTEPFVVSMTGVAGEGTFYVYRDQATGDRVQLAFSFDPGTVTIMLGKFQGGSLVDFDFVQFDSASDFDLQLTMDNGIATVTGTVLVVSQEPVNLTLDVTGYQPGNQIGMGREAGSVEPLYVDTYSVCPA